MDSPLFVAAVLVIAGVLTLEFGISSAITELVAGMLLALFVDVTPMGWLKFLAHFGMLGLMFMAGFEVDVAVVRRTWRESLGIGLSTTSLALVFHFLKERDLLEGETGQTILGAAMVVDILSMMGMALLLGEVGWGTLIFFAAAAPAVWNLPRVGEWIFRRYRGSVVEFELRFLLLVLVGLGFLAEHVGIHAAVVSFAVGLILAEVVQDHLALEEKMKGIVFSFLAPIFFLRAGTQIQMRQLDLSTLGMGSLFLLVAVGLKYGGTFLAARWLQPGLGHFAGILFNYRLTFGIITATVGVQEGLFDQRLFSIILLVVLASALMPMVLLRDLPSELLE